MNSNRYALVTGSSSGLGLDIAKRLAARGYNIVLTGRRGELLEVNREEIENLYHVYVRVVAGDLSSRGEVINLYSKCSDLDIEILVNNAGRGLFGLFNRIDNDEVEGMLNLNINSLTLLSNLFARNFSKKKRGYILNIASMAAFQATPYFASYAASKSYVLNFSLALREELRPYGVKVSCLLPGYIKTDFDSNSNINDSTYLRFSKRNSLTSEYVSRAAIKLIFRGGSYSVPGLLNKFGAFFSSLIPRGIQGRIVYRFISTLLKGGQG